jgi:hypothetical protein
MKKFVLLAAVLCIWSIRFASGQVPGQSLFDNSIVHEIKITSLYESLVDTLTSNYVLSFGLGQMQLREIPYAPALLTIDGTAIDTLGLRYKGFNSWWSSVKKPIKVDIDKYRKDQKYDGLAKFNLHNGSGDPTFIRENTIYKMLRSLGVKAPRTAYAKVYIDTMYMGLYRIVEQVDNTFLDLNFGNHDGNLYAQQSKGSAGFPLSWLGNAREDYYPSLALENHQKQNDWSALIHFLDVLNNSPDETFRNEILPVFAVDEFLQILAVDVAMNNIDSYAASGRNYYLAEVDGKFHWIPWDYNLTWRSDAKPVNIEPADYPVLISRLLHVPEFYSAFLRKFCALQPYLSDEYMGGLVAEELALLKPLMEIDPHLDYPVEAFETNMESEWQGLPGLKEFAAQRHHDISATLKELTINCEIVNGIPPEPETVFSIYPMPAKDIVNIEILSNETADVAVMNSLGQNVANFKITGKYSVDTSSLLSGFYVIKICIGRKISSRILSVER